MSPDSSKPVIHLSRPFMFCPILFYPALSLYTTTLLIRLSPFFWPVCSCPRPTIHITLHVMYVLLSSHSCWSSLSLTLRTHPSIINRLEAYLHTLNLKIATNRFSPTSSTLSSFSLILSCEGADCVFSKPFRQEHLASLLAYISHHGTKSSLKSHSLIKPEQKKFYTDSIWKLSYNRNRNPFYT